MPGSWSADDFPRLNEDNCQVTSPATRRYNCLAWAAAEDSRWWWPDAMGIGYWPPDVPRTATLEAFLQAYRTLAYEPCEGSALEPGVEKIALYGKTGSTGIPVPTHAALQLESGKWTSKLGSLEDMTHDTAESLSGPLYGEPIVFLSRPRL